MMVSRPKAGLSAAFRLFVLLLILPYGFSAPGSPTQAGVESIAPVDAIQAMIDQVDSATVSSYTGSLSGEWPVTIGGSPYTITTRYSRSVVPIEKATQYAFEHLEALGLDTQYHTFMLSGSQKRNVIAEQPGVEQPGRIFMITAHLDDYSGDPYNFAPGADDNASGSTAVLIAADILSQYAFDCTLRYALFTGEEQGKIGSLAYAQRAFNLGEGIEAVLNLDMIGYNSDLYPFIELHTRPGNASDQAIANLFADVISAYEINLTPQIQPSNIQRSDHASFWTYGYPAILAIEDFDDLTPHYHTIGDTLETLDLAYFTDFVKAAVGTLAHLGCLRPMGYLAGTVNDAESAAPLESAQVQATGAGGRSWMASTGADGSYRLALGAGAYHVQATKPGYVSGSYPGIQVTAGYTTTLDIPLQVCHSIQDADFHYSPAAPITGQATVFTGTVGLGSTAPLSFAWDFRDGSLGSGAVITHTYTISDVYPVQMTVSNCGGSASVEHALSVTGYPEIELLPGMLQVQAFLGQAVTQLLVVGNPGGDELTWSLSEQPEVGWLAASPMGGVVAPGQSGEIELVFIAPEAVGVYTTALQVASDDADEPLLSVPIRLTVSPWTAYFPLIAVSAP